MCSNTYGNKANLVQQYATLTETGAALNIYKPSPVQIKHLHNPFPLQTMESMGPCTNWFDDWKVGLRIGKKKP